jgi:arylsulfatase A-like enzyme
MPTVAELANAPKPQQLDGHSFARLLLAQPTATNDVQFYWEDHDSGSGRAGRIGQWKGIQSEKQKIQLYDLESDPAETRDVGPAHPERVKQFEALFAENYRPWRPPPDAAVVAAGRPGHLIPTNIVTKPMRTNVLNQPSSTPKQP